MLVANLLSLLSIICFALSQNKHFKTVFNKQPTNENINILKALGILFVALPHYFLQQQPQLGVSYVVWGCWLSVWIVLVGAILSYLAKR